MALCDNCEFYNKDYDIFRQTYDDCEVVNGDNREKHFCVMHDDFIPMNIAYDNGSCSYFVEKGAENMV